MWICLNNAFLSIIESPDHPDLLRVRARRAGDIESVFPGASVRRTPGRDYLYRTELERDVVAQAIATRLTSISYTNFKDSVSDNALHRAYATTWGTMARLQSVPPYGRDRRDENMALIP